MVNQLQFQFQAEVESLHNRIRFPNLSLALLIDKYRGAATKQRVQYPRRRAINGQWGLMGIINHPLILMEINGD